MIYIVAMDFNPLYKWLLFFVDWIKIQPYNMDRTFGCFFEYPGYSQFAI
ncbi:MAG: hypothetical protein ABI892_12580 [Flavobacterium sp.]